MIDGMGMCGVCRVTVGGKMMFGCVDGPEFDGHQTDFAGLIQRQRQMLPEERLSSLVWKQVEVVSVAETKPKPKLNKKA